MTVAGYLSVAEASRYLGRSPRWIRRRLPEIPHYKPPAGQILFKVSDLEAYLERFRVEPSAPPELDLEQILGEIAPRRRRVAK